MARTNDVAELRARVDQLAGYLWQLIGQLPELNPSKIIYVEGDKVVIRDRKPEPPPKYRHEVTLYVERDDPELPWQFKYDPLMGFATKGQKTTRIQ